MHSICNSLYKNFLKKSFFNLFLIGGAIALQCCVGFCHATMQLSHNYTYITSLLNLPPLLSPYPFRSSQSTRLGSLCLKATSCQLSLLHMTVYICQCYFLHLSHSLLLPMCPQVHSLYLSLHTSHGNRFMSTIFLDSIYMN